MPGPQCGCGQEWSNDMVLHSLEDCIWMKRTGDMIYSGYDEPTNHDLNVTKSYCELAIKPCAGAYQHGAYLNMVHWKIKPLHHTMVICLMCNVSEDVLVVNTIAAPVLITVDFNMASSELKYDKHVFELLEDVCEFMVCQCNSKSAHHDGVTTTSSGK